MTTYRVLITGVTGFVGAYLARQLIDSGNEVIGLLHSRSDGHKPKRLKDMDIISNMTFVRGDITDLTSILSAISYAPFVMQKRIYFRKLTLSIWQILSAVCS
jgi:GDP-D-mannose dehydratase